MKTIEKLIVILVIILLVVGIYFGLRNIDFFNIEEVEISVSGPVTTVSSDMQSIINPLKGQNIFEVNLRSLSNELKAFNGVKDVSVKRFYPGKLIIDVSYNDISLKAFSLLDGELSYYFIHDNSLEEITHNTWDEFDKLMTVEINPAYAQMILKWGADNGFNAMTQLAEHLASNNLITSIKYDNNNGSDFGRLAINISSVSAVLYVRELVSTQRLDEALDVVLNQFSANGVTVIYDLYSNTLVKRT